MKVLHTADWHLGKYLEQCDRIDEHSRFLQWLIQTIIENEIEALIIAGDIFDTGNPSNTALKQYYDFLLRIKDTSCREVIIIGGNHDSVSTLNAPKELLEYLNVHVMGGVPENIEDQIIQLKDINGHLALIVCAVPFLRDKDVRLSVSGETAEEREGRIKQGIVDHYHNLLPYIQGYKANGIPVVATGHLFAAGSVASPESEKEIFVGNLGQIGGNQFPIEFNYIALGHLHRPQVVNRLAHIRYSGSPIAFSFSESEHEKMVLLLDFKKNELVDIKEIKIPCYRRLKRIVGSVEKVKTHLAMMDSADMCQLPTWVEVQVETESFILDLNEQLNQIVIGKTHIEHVFIKQIRQRVYPSVSETVNEYLSLNDLTPREVFQRKCATELPEGSYKEILETFDEALVLMNRG